MPGGTHTLFDEDRTGWSATGVKALQNAGHNILYTYIDTVYRTENKTGIDLGSQTGTRANTSSGEWWRPTLIGLDVGVAVGLVAWGVLTVFFTWFKKKTV